MNAKNLREDCVDWIKNYFEEQASPETKAIVGISGGKDSSIVAALCVEALGRDRVLGVLMPENEQKDLDMAIDLCQLLSIDYQIINIGEITKSFYQIFSPNNNQIRTNLPARVRMTALYAVAAELPCGGRIANTCNLSEDYVGYSTKFGDSAGDFSPLSNLTVTEVRAIGFLMLPPEFVYKTPDDGMCGKSDEENLGFSYAYLDDLIRAPLLGRSGKIDKDLDEKINKMHKYSRHKINPMPKFEIYNTADLFSGDFD